MIILFLPKSALNKKIAYSNVNREHREQREQSQKNINI